MKKTLLLSGALFAATLAAAVTTNTASANADYTSKEGDSTADFSINPTTQDGQADGNTLWLSAEPSFTFNAGDLSTVMAKGQTLDAVEDKRNTLTVNDFTGDSLGWTVKAQLSDFVSADKKDTIPGSTLTYTQTLGDAVNFKSSVSPASLTSTESPVLTAANGEGQGTTSTTASGAKLVLQPHANAKPQQYTANITWTLTQGAPVEGSQPVGGTQASGNTTSNPS
ncbi:WxL domain-containing protein [Lacticaseibacillus porcinae]|uniref:WxL domain-containing protein n=1 Tax=Lacticaseibacillus porcinae TaxID=1123687 RepID=UPI000F794271|nr:WxL domain-containing protein [Lacticaseibacillus porcinae]